MMVTEVWSLKSGYPSSLYFSSVQLKRMCIAGDDNADDDDSSDGLIIN